MRYIRLIVGTFLIIGAFYIIVREQMAGASANAFINAEVVTIRAPSAGNVSMPERPLGSPVSTDDWVASVQDPQADRVRLNDLELERDMLMAEIAGAQARVTTLTESLARMSELEAAYHSARIDELESQDTGDGNALASRAKQDDVTQDDGTERLTQAAQPRAIDDVRDMAELQLDWAKRDVFLDNSAGAAWNHVLKSHEARVALSAAEQDLAAANAKLAAMNQRIVRERQRVVMLNGGDLNSPVSGLVWERLAADGTNVQRGDPILRIADCRSVVVSLSVPESVYNTLSIGDAASFRQTGGDQIMQGTVSRLGGLGARTIYRNMAVAPSQTHLERFDVTLIVPDLRVDPRNGCGIGRTGRVFFDDRPLDGFRQFWN